jgi:hypothetical protein
MFHIIYLKGGLPVKNGTKLSSTVHEMCVQWNTQRMVQEMERRETKKNIRAHTENV